MLTLVAFRYERRHHPALTPRFVGAMPCGNRQGVASVADLPDPDDRRLRELAAKVRAAQRDEQKRHGPATVSSGARGYRMATDFIAAVLVGAGIGFGLDWLFGTVPWLMIGMTLLGFAAGVRMVMRLAEAAMAEDGTAQDGSAQDDAGQPDRPGSHRSGAGRD